MNKTTEALKLAEEALAFAIEAKWHEPEPYPAEKALAAIREALAEPVQEPMCKHGVDDGACIECYLEAITKPVKQDTMSDYFDFGLEEVEDYLRTCCSNNFMADKLSEIRKSIAAPVQPVKQEPVDFETWWNETGQETLYALNTLTDADAKILAKIAWESASTQPVKQEPVAWLFQHEETGRTMCVDVQQVEGNFEKNNPRLQKIHPLYREPVDAKAIRAEALEEAAKVCDEHFGIFDDDREHGENCAAAIRGLK